LKKRLYYFLAPFLIFWFFSYASSSSFAEDNIKLPEVKPCKEGCMVPSDKDIEEKKNEKRCKKCDTCEIDDDEYCVYNQCYLDKQYRILKTILCLDEKQEQTIDNIYFNFKTDMEILCARYTVEKNKLLDMIAQDDCNYKRQLETVKDLRRSMKESVFEFKSDTRDKLCKNQRKEFKKFTKYQKKKIKKIIKYSAIYKFPCSEN